MSEKILKWCEIAEAPSEIRYQVLSKYLNEQGQPNEFTPLICANANFEQTLKEATQTYDQIRLGPPYGERIFEFFPNSPILLFPIKSADSLAKNEGTWWPRSLLLEAFSEQVTFFKNIDMLAAALIVGAGAAARAIVGSLVRTGYTQINITDFDQERGQRVTGELARTFFNVKFKFMDPAGLTGLAGIHSIVVNATPLVTENNMLEELYYFNFLIPGGIAVDLNVLPIETPFLKMALEVNAHVIYGWEIAAISDLIWARHCFGRDFGWDYRKYLESELKSRSSV